MLLDYMVLICLLWNVMLLDVLLVLLLNCLLYKFELSAFVRLAFELYVDELSAWILYV